MALVRYGLWDADIPFGSYLEATHEWYRWALKAHQGLPSGHHPLKDSHGKNAMVGQPTEKRLLFLGTYWSRGSDSKVETNTPFIREFEIESGLSILINAASSMIVPEKHPDKFPIGVETTISKYPKDITDRARAIIDQAFAVVTVRHEQKPITWFSSYSGELERVRPQRIMTFKLDEGIWDNFSKGGRVHAACDGY